MRGDNRVALGAGEYGGEGAAALAYQRVFLSDWAATASVALDGDAVRLQK